MLEIKRPLHKDILELAKKYIEFNDNEFRPLELRCVIHHMNKCHREHFMRIAVNDGVIVGGMIASPQRLLHSLEIPYVQECCCCFVTGLLAYRIVVGFHEEFEIHAKSRGFTRLISSCNTADEHHKFAKALERNGWQRRGYVAQKLLG